jgi:hypothetical protein
MSVKVHLALVMLPPMRYRPTITDLSASGIR